MNSARGGLKSQNTKQSSCYAGLSCPGMSMPHRPATPFCLVLPTDLIMFQQVEELHQPTGICHSQDDMVSN